ncbi:MAG TPA: glycoside hydrolase family 76 protein [Sphingobacterium sp.]|jgi:predicted alpha-1,6-mannanase (GH76 family)|nr:glycoside hydrolase family 76 protein [Sphingobacterium sp.]
MKIFATTIYCSVLLIVAATTGLCAGCAAYPSRPGLNGTGNNPPSLAVQNLERSINLIDVTISHYFDPTTFEMRRFYNPFTNVKSEERASVWMYTAGIEAVNAVLSGLKQAKESGHSRLYDLHYARYVDLLDKLYANADYYLGTFELVSFTQTRTWSVYAVDRVKEKGQANVKGVLNVYDDQMWLIRELLDSYKLTGKAEYLNKAEYLTAYVLDGWDVTRDENGKENGGIPWGPGYTTKHACSNGPLISPLVWLHEIYKGKPDEIEHRFVDEKDGRTRRSRYVTKQQYYLDYARSIYGWQQSMLLNAEGVYADMMGGCVPNCDVRYEEVNGVRYRANTALSRAVGQAYTYNSGTMLSGAADLYRATGDDKYLEDGRSLARASFAQFASLGRDIPEYYSFGTDGFKNWFNGILLRGYHDAAAFGEPAVYLNAFQKNLDYGFAHFNHNGFLPTNLLKGWAEDKEKQGVEGMFMFAYAAQYAILAKHELPGGL